MALAIGATLTMFSLMRAVLWRPLPYPEPDRIVTIQVDARNVPNTGATPGEVLDLKERARSFTQVSMLDTGNANLEYRGETDHVVTARVSDEFLPLLGVRPALGRALNAQLDEARNPPTPPPSEPPCASTTSPCGSQACSLPVSASFCRPR